jgi:chromosomal replication initiator protein
MEELTERLRSRFEWGLTVEIKPPDFETRLGILQTKALAQGFELPQESAELLGHHIRGSIRDLEGILNQALARAAFAHQPLGTDLIIHLIQDQHGQEPENIVELTDIFEATARYHQLTLDDLLGKQRSHQIAMARHMAIYLAREEFNATLPAIGRALGGRSHSTIISSYRKASNLANTDPAFRRALDELRQQLQVPQ